MHVHNLMEDVVKQCLKELLAHKPEMEHCDERSQSDIIAITLNRLPPKYVATTKGEVLAKTQLRAQVESDVYRELSYAVDKVMRTPSRSDLRDQQE